MTATETGAVFDAAGADYGRVQPALWDPAGEFTVRHSAPQTGERVLDACCGAGSSAIPAARAVGPQGRVDAIDLAPSLLALGRRRAASLGLEHCRFHSADATLWAPETGYDLVQCVYGVFLLEDMDAGTRALAGRLRPGGRMALTVWRKGALEDYARPFYETVNAHRPVGQEQAAPPGRSPIERIYTEDALASWMGETLGLKDIEVHTVPGSVPLTPELAWEVILGSGFRGALARFGQDSAAIDAVRRDFLALLDRRGVDSMDTTSLVALGVVR